jgi:hypothetical protein
MSRVGWIVVVSALAACGGPAAAQRGAGRPAVTGSREPRAEAMPHQACADGGGDVQQVDVNGDGRADIRTVIRGGQVFCRETDANFDGRVDVVRFFDAQGQPVRVEDDYDFDGRIDVVASYENGEIRTDVLDTNFDGRTDTWRDYRNGRVIELRRDANSDGRVDTWESFDEGGRLVRSAIDTDGDGRPDEEPDAAVAGTDAAVTTTPAAPPVGGAPQQGMGGAPAPTTTGAGSAQP